MEDHIIDPEKAGMLEKDGRYRIISREEVLSEIEEGDLVADIGSGTGFFADDMSRMAERVYAVDFQEQMHEYYREKGVPENVGLISASASEFNPDEELDVVFLITSLHEVRSKDAVENLSSILADNGRLVVMDWSSNSETDEVPPKEKLFSADEAEEFVSEFFDVQMCQERFDTFVLKAQSLD